MLIPMRLHGKPTVTCISLPYLFGSGVVAIAHADILIIHGLKDEFLVDDG
jgi:hypothetical protein